MTTKGILLACASGALASGIGYALWYRALKNLSLTQAAVSQLSVPLIAALAGVIWVGESITQGLIISGGLIIIGIALVSVRRR